MCLHHLPSPLMAIFTPIQWLYLHVASSLVAIFTLMQWLYLQDITSSLVAIFTLMQWVAIFTTCGIFPCGFIYTYAMAMFLACDIFLQWLYCGSGNIHVVIILKILIIIALPIIKKRYCSELYQGKYNSVFFGFISNSYFSRQYVNMTKIKIQ